eukprot:scaffold1384_cov222-Chaetoceros_neogracile.AAC.4
MNAFKLEQEVEDGTNAVSPPCKNLATSTKCASATARRADEWAEQHALAKGMEQKRRDENESKRIH